MYPHEFTNIHAFVQRVALDMVRYGYLYYVTGRVPEGRDPSQVDAKILSRYDIDRIVGDFSAETRAAARAELPDATLELRTPLLAVAAILFLFTFRRRSA